MNNRTYFVLPTGKGKGGVDKQDVKIVENLFKEISNAHVFKCYTRMDLMAKIKGRNGRVFSNSTWGIAYKINEDISEQHKFVIQDLTSALLAEGPSHPTGRWMKRMHEPKWKPIN